MNPQLVFQVSIKKDELITKIRANRANHQAIFEEALEGYKKEIIKLLEERLAAAKQGKRISHYITLVQPESHLDDYDRVLEMLEMSTQDTITVSETQFAWYARDEWDWKQNFLSRSAHYSDTAAAELPVNE